MKRAASLLVFASLLSGCTLVPESGARQPSAQARYSMTTTDNTPRSPVAQPGSLGTTPPPMAMNAEARQCLTELSQTGAQDITASTVLPSTSKRVTVQLPSAIWASISSQLLAACSSVMQ